MKIFLKMMKLKILKNKNKNQDQGSLQLEVFNNIILIKSKNKKQLKKILQKKMIMIMKITKKICQIIMLIYKRLLIN